MEKRVKHFMILTACFLLAACSSNPFSDSYVKEAQALPVETQTENPTVYNANTAADVRLILKTGYMIMGTSSFSAPMVSIHEAIDYGEKIGADAILFSEELFFEENAIEIGSRESDATYEYTTHYLTKLDVNQMKLGAWIQNASVKTQQKIGTNIGAVLRVVYAGTAAEQAGLVDGDVVVEFNNQRIFGYKYLSNSVQKSKVGVATSLKIWRQGKMLDKTVLLR
ncbi:MAG: PDZ domain-containing protein [Alphaproteobacteria bacterium]